MPHAHRQGTLYSTVVCALIAAVPALAQLLPEPQHGQLLPLLTARSGVYAVAAGGIMGGFIDYLTLLNSRDGGIAGLALVWEECETASTTDRAVACYARLKTTGRKGAPVFHPLSSDIAAALLERATSAKPPLITLGHGRSEAADGRVIPYLFPLLASDWSQIAAQVHYIQSVVRAVVRTPTVITPAHVQRMQDALQDAVSTPVHLIVRSVPIRMVDTGGYLYETPATPAPLTGAALALQQQLESLVNSHLKALPGTSFLALHAVPQHDGLRLIAIVRTPQSITPEQVQPVEADLLLQVSPKIELVVRSVIGSDATATGFLGGSDSAPLLPQRQGASHVQ